MASLLWISFQTRFFSWCYGAYGAAMRCNRQEKARQREMEEGMRRTLLRGMSAMNMEAMRLMTEAR